MGSVGRGRVGIDGNPDDNRTESPLLDVHSVGDSEEAGGVDGVAPLDGGVDQVVNEGTDCVPDPVERRFMDRTGELERWARNSASRGQPGVLLPARTVEQLGLLAVVGDAIIVPGSLLRRDCVSRANRLITSLGGERECREVRVLAQG